MLENESDFLRYITVKKGLTAGSVKTCKSRFKVLFRWLKENSLNLNADSIEAFFFHLRETGRTNNTLNTYIFTCRYIKDYLQDRGYEYKFMETLQSFDKDDPVIIPLTDSEIERLLEVRLSFGKFRGKDTNFLDDVYRTMIRFIAFTGCRFDEADKIQIKHLDLGAEKVMLAKTKNKDTRMAYFTEPLTSELKLLVENKSSEDYVFTNSMGKTVHPSDFSIDLKTRARKAGITKRVHPHILRHSYATIQYESGNDIAMVANLLGHKDIQTTYNTYVKIADKSRRKASYRHPSMRKNMNPIDILEYMQESIKGFEVDKDTRFSETFKKGLIDLFYEEASRLRGTNCLFFFLFPWVTIVGLSSVNILMS